MFGPESGKRGWKGLPFVYEKVRISDSERCQKFLSLFTLEGCRMEVCLPAGVVAVVTLICFFYIDWVHSCMCLCSSTIITRGCVMLCCDRCCVVLGWLGLWTATLGWVESDWAGFSFFRARNITRKHTN